MATLFFTHPAGLAHRAPPGHPERSGRLEAVEAALAAPVFAALIRETAPPAPAEAIARAHDAAYLAALERAAPAEATVMLDADTYMTPASLSAARHAAGAVVAAIDRVMAGDAANAFCAMRPPGHHAERGRAMGFCLLSSAAIGALHAVHVHGLDRVAVVDFDVHHGNGTQDVLWDEARVFFASSQQMPLYPGTGARSERGAHGQILNLPLAPGTDGPGFRRAWEAELLPALEAARPELIVISAGFDAHRDDPLASLALEAADFAWATQRIADIAHAHGGGRIVSTLEGGYDLDALAASVAAHVTALMERGNG